MTGIVSKVIKRNNQLVSHSLTSLEMCDGTLVIGIKQDVNVLF